MKRLIKRLSDLPDELMRRAQASAISAANHAAQIARDLAPVETGELRGSISASPAEGGASVQAAAPHAVMVEYGTSRMPPQPFMLPAAHAAAQEYFNGVDTSKL